MENEIYGVPGVRHLFPDEIKNDTACLTHFTFKEKDDFMFNLRAARDGGRMFRMFDGDYVRLHVNGELMMSDTGMERYSNMEFIKKANGKVLIAGLGIGLILNAIQNKKEVAEIIVIEKHQSVIDIVSSKFPKVKIICADINKWMPDKKEKFDTIYFDIWADISTDNLDEIKILHNKFKNKLNRTNSNCWMNSWMKEYLQEKKRKESKYW